MRRFSSKNRKRAGNKGASKDTRIVRGTILDRNPGNRTYMIHYFLMGNEVEEWFKVSDATSLSYEEEKKRHITAMDNIQKMPASHLTVKAEQMISCGATDSKHAVSSPPSSPKLAGQPVSSLEVKTCSLHPTGDTVTPEGTDIVVFLKLM